MTNEIFKEEILNEEQLDMVSGGRLSESRVDSKFFSKLGYNMNNLSVEDVFNAHGIKFDQNWGDNTYEFYVTGLDGFNSAWKKYPHFAALGRVLERRRYPGFNGSWTDSKYVMGFLKEHFGITSLG